MEAKWLFDVSLDQIQVVVHPQSIVHSAVEYDDGAVIAQLGLPDMKLPIQYALLYPERRPMRAPFMDLFAIHQLTFEAPDTETFPGLALAYRAAREGGSMRPFSMRRMKWLSSFCFRKRSVSCRFRKSWKWRWSIIIL